MGSPRRRRSRRIAATDVSLYADSSALVKLVVDEPETMVVASAVRESGGVATSSLAFVEIARAVARAAPAADAVGAAERVLQPLLLVEADVELLRQAAGLVGDLRSLDAIHLASALTVGASQMLVYDLRLAGAAAAAGLKVLAPT